MTESFRCLTTSAIVPYLDASLPPPLNACFTCRYDGYFVDLFVRVTNDIAINMYKKFGYVVYRRVIGYYSGIEEEDAFGMLAYATRHDGLGGAIEY